MAVLELAGPDAPLSLESYEPLHVVMPSREPLLSRVTEYLLAYGAHLPEIIEVRVVDSSARSIAHRWQKLAPIAVKIVETEQHLKNGS